MPLGRKPVQSGVRATVSRSGVSHTTRPRWSRPTRPAGLAASGPRSGESSVVEATTRPSAESARIVPSWPLT